MIDQFQTPFFGTVLSCSLQGGLKAVNHSCKRASDMPNASTDKILVPVQIAPESARNFKKNDGERTRRCKKWPNHSPRTTGMHPQHQRGVVESSAKNTHSEQRIDGPPSVKPQCCLNSGTPSKPKGSKSKGPLECCQHRLPLTFCEGSIVG